MTSIVNLLIVRAECMPHPLLSIPVTIPKKPLLLRYITKLNPHFTTAGGALGIFYYTDVFLGG